MAKISGCVFDFGGVMTSTSMPERVRPLAEGLGVPWSALEEGFARYRRLMDGGFITLDEMYDNIWADAGVSPEKSVRARILKEDQASYLYRNEDTLRLMRALKTAGFKIGILTNMPSPFAARFRRGFPDFIALADAMVVSGEEKMFKPQRRIYDLLRDRISLPADGLCFFDDSPANCDGARAAGWSAILFRGAAQAAREFSELSGTAVPGF